MPPPGKATVQQRRRRRPLNLKKYSKRERVQQLEGVPTETEWNAMKRLGSFTIDVQEKLDEENYYDTGSSSDPDDSGDTDTTSIVTTGTGTKLISRPVTFCKGNDARLFSVDDDTENAWIGRIRQIRRDLTDDKVWVKVYWYYSGFDIKQTLLRKFNPADFSPYERAASDDCDIVSARSFLGVVYVHDYDEHRLDPPDIEPDTFFTRTYIQPQKKIIEPKPGTETCLCRQAYIPYPWQGSSIASPKDDAAPDSMHFCPRENCRTWYHTSCLMKYGRVDDFNVTCYEGDRGVRLLAVNPDSDLDCAVLSSFSRPHDLDDSTSETSELNRSLSGTPATTFSTLAPPLSPLSLSEIIEQMAVSYRIAHLPSSLVRLAQSPIVRRPGIPPPDSGWSAVGNVKEVVLARRFVYAALEGFHPENGEHPAGQMEERMRDMESLLEAMERGEIWAFDGEAGEHEREDMDVMMDVDGEGEEHMNEEREAGNGNSHASGNAGAGAIVDDKERRLQILEKLCVELTETILLASPYQPYWERREHELETEMWMNTPPLVCPNCRGAI
ncbi:uncharacterized protein LAESUDRAFT_674547 [Laetiporus sulphureus 93-53]|uniref:BAH domain-containing protein n=1 Tax=Laetiporus sulphureus 93-53 TaxID=1314785 RepID=A0A165G0F7_9APHY|nr:uncharacterized protein LAESUDRAFT_674547 [Laetiporus sulphureus 93-53]KZT09662.1 hypothetical protein LAESUDRAFT_674547 [Laetiporus sulphureus 93-53]